ncbi:CAAX prenyl protease 1 like protein [Dictyocoela muelleri]|nr:CAAX prenyl protease 1 like protein [Dictyocoela muelleri]
MWIYSVMKIGLVFNFIIYIYLALRQLIALKKSKYTKFIKSVMSEKDFKISKNYNNDKLLFSIVKTSVDTMKTYFYIHLLFLPKAYEFVNEHFIRYLTKNYELSQIIFIILMTHFERIVDIPFELFETFYIEQKYGFNTMSLGLFFNDFLKYTLVFTIIGYFPLQVILFLIDYCKKLLFLHLWGSLLVLQIVLIIVYPTLIQPFFNKFTELEDGSLKRKINELARSVGFNTDKIHIVDGSKRSHHSNAYFVGFFNIKRIVLYDTMFKDLENDEQQESNHQESNHQESNHQKIGDQQESNHQKIGDQQESNHQKIGDQQESNQQKIGEQNFKDEVDDVNNEGGKNFNDKKEILSKNGSNKFQENQILAILAHELGHWYHKHIYKLILAQSLILLISLYFLESFIKIEILFNGNDTPMLIKVFYFQLFISAINPILALFMNFISRKCEVEADKFACDKGYHRDLINALIILHRENKTNLNHDWLYSLFNHSHPTLNERVTFIENELKKKE